MKWIRSVPFVLSANFRSGDLLVSYPYDLSKHPQGNDTFSPTPDEKVFKFLAGTYANAHETMSSRNTGCGQRGANSQKGILNGAQRFSFAGCESMHLQRKQLQTALQPLEAAVGSAVRTNQGNSNQKSTFLVFLFMLPGMQDFNYLHTNCFEVTVALGCDKFPDQEELFISWRDNQEALIKFLEAVHRGIKGIVKDGNGEGIKGARISVRGIRHDVTSDENGEYWRLLTPGVHVLSASAPGYASAHKIIHLPPDMRKAGRVDFVLRRDIPEGSGALQTTEGYERFDPHNQYERYTQISAIGQRSGERAKKPWWWYYFCLLDGPEPTWLLKQY